LHNKDQIFDAVLRVM